MAHAPMQLRNSNDWSNYLKTLNLNSAKDRLQTLYRWSPGKYLHTDLNKIAEDGFYYFGEGDTIKCQYCSLGLSSWTHRNDTANDHKTFFEKCLHLQGKANQNISLSTADRAPAYVSYFDRTERENSFQNCDNIKEHAKKLAKAGFFCAGFDNIIICFQCGKHGNDWARGVDAWAPHTMHHSACPLVAVQKTSPLTADVGGQVNIRNEKNQRLLVPCGHQIGCEEYPGPLNVCHACYEIVDSIVILRYP